MKKIALPPVVILSLLFVLFPYFPFEKTAFSSGNHFTVGVENISYFPHYAVKNGRYVGLAPDILNAYAQKRGYRFTYEPLPVNRLHRMLHEDKIDFIYPNNPDWLAEMKGKKKIHYSDPVVRVIDGMVLLPEKKGKGIKQLKNVGTVQGFTLPAYEGAIRSGDIEVSESYEFEGLLGAVIKGFVDGAYVTVDSAMYHLKDVLGRPKALVFDPDLPYDVAAHMLSSTLHPEIIPDFNRFLAEEKAMIDALKHQYGIIEESQSR